MSSLAMGYNGRALSACKRSYGRPGTRTSPVGPVPPRLPLRPCRPEPRPRLEPVEAKAAAAGAAAAVAAARPPPTQDPLVIWNALTAPMVAPLVTAVGGEGSWQYYLASRFIREVVAVVLVAVLAYKLLQMLAAKAQEEEEIHHQLDTQRRRGDTRAPNDAAAEAAHLAAHSGGGEVLRVAALAATSPAARALFTGLLALTVARYSFYIMDGFITTFNPKLPTDWLDDLVRLIVDCLAPLDDFLVKLSLIGMALFGCAVVLRYKDVLITRYVRAHFEVMERGSELVQNFVNPASNILSWVVVLATAGWLATGLGVNLKPLLAVGGASSIIIGLATQQVLSNFVSGLNIFLSRPFVAGEYISLVSQNMTSQTNISGRVIRVDPMRTLIAMEDGSTTAVPNQVIAVSIVVNRSRTPHWSVGSASPLLANPKELKWRMRLPHAALDKVQELEAEIERALANTLPTNKVRYSPAALEFVRFSDTGAEVTAKVTLVWRLKAGPSIREQQDRQETMEVLMQTALLSLQKVVRGCDGVFMTA
ncbi:hypothetical protein HYH03_017236 [Edaphochlamys debaryana]|uniref:Mechanosensitive ion channel MscS domain-containing protein n=1 Tax=Edaphochlamys debaryana TaxID=47281 RepID=A0A835XIB3_9CHLO|nr:hypothetical protein HYH03_017236 [Edaphochlamys debaryana]|eukprot:KAG2483915.1 hypothetical protein HYH03_017236 [Edaphochlamys debaryana]